MKHDSPITKANLIRKYVSITPLGEVRLSCGKNIFRLFKKAGTRNAEITAEYLAQSLRNIILNEAGDIAEDNTRLHDLLYKVKSMLDYMFRTENYSLHEIKELYDLFADYEDVLPGQDYEVQDEG